MQSQMTRASRRRPIPFRVVAEPRPGGGDVKDAIDRLTQGFEDYKKANDEVLKAKADSGTIPPELQAKMEKADKTIDELKAAMDKAVAEAQKRNDDLETKLNRLGFAGGGAADNDERKFAAAFYTQINAAKKIHKRIEADDGDLDLEGYHAYRNAFEALVRGNGRVDGLSNDIRNALSVGSDPSGGYFVPTEMSTEIVSRIYDTSPMRSIARVRTIGVPAWEAPYKSSQGVSGGWVAEKQARTTTGTQTVGMQRIETHEQYAFPEVTQNMLDDAAINVQDFLVGETEDVMVRTENTAFVTGTGVDRPKGYLDYASASVTTDDATRAWGVLQYVPSGAAGAFPNDSQGDDATALIDVIAKLNPAYRNGATWTMNRTTEAAVRKLRDSQGRYLVGFGDIRDGVTGFSLHGFPIVNLEDMADIASDSYSISFGNFTQGYYIIDRMGFSLLVDPYTNKPYVGFYITKRTGGDVRNFDAIKLLKFAAS